MPPPDWKVEKVRFADVVEEEDEEEEVESKEVDE